MQFNPKLSPASLSSSACRTFRHGEFGNYGKTLPAKLLPKLLINSIVLCFWFMFYSQRIKNQTKFYGKLHNENADHLEMRTSSELNSGHWVALPICNLANGKLITRERERNCLWITNAILMEAEKWVNMCTMWAYQILSPEICIEMPQRYCLMRNKTNLFDSRLRNPHKWPENLMTRFMWWNPVLILLSEQHSQHTIRMMEKYIDFHRARTHNVCQPIRHTRKA